MNDHNVMNLDQFRLIIIFSMLYMSIMLCNSILTNRYIGTDEFFVLGGTLTSPFFFIFGDIIAEIFGYRVTRQMIWWGFAWQTLFAILCQLVIIAPHPSFTKSPESYSFVLGQLFWIDFSSFAGPATWLVGYIKRKTGIDVYDFPTSFTPFKYKKEGC